MTKKPSAPATRKFICNLVRSKDTDKDWSLESALNSRAVAAAPPKLPESVDLRASWWDVGNQEQTGSCVGWSSTDGVARYHFVQAGRLGKKERLSPRFTWMASKETDEFTSRPQAFIEEAGTSLKAAVDVLRKYGAAPEALLPFHISTNMYLNDENTFYSTVAMRKIAAYYNLKKNILSWKKWLAGNGPILAGLDVDDTWENATATKGKLDNFQPSTVRGGHAIAIVGYTADKRFIIRNSWGEDWGDKGYAYASEEYISAAFFDESYGVTL